MSANFALTIENISKTFKRERSQQTKALDDVSLNIPQGKIFGLLGPNGAGKSTLINIISNVLLPDQGKIHLFDINVAKHPRRAKKMMGVVPQEIVVEPAFTVDEVLFYFAGMYGVPVQERSERIGQVLFDLGLEDKRFDRARSLSGGMKRRLMIAKAVMHKPKFLILDEPTAGVDVVLRQRIWNLVRRLREEGTTILFTTHYLEEAEELCESIALINHGKIVKHGKLADIQNEFSKNVIHFELFDHDHKHLDGVEKMGTIYEYPIKHLAKDMADVVDFYGPALKSIKNEKASLEQIFLTLTK